MLVRCIANTAADLPAHYINPAPYGYPKVTTDYDLTVGREYTVYAVESWEDKVAFYIGDDGKWGYPLRIPAPLFEVIDGQPSRFWKIGVRESESRGVRWGTVSIVLIRLKLRKWLPRDMRTHSCLLMGFPAWVEDPYFYDDLTDWKPEAKQVWDNFRHLMDLEFPDSDASETPDVVGDGWLFCSPCIDGWKPEGIEATLGVVICPQCGKHYRNPLHEAGITALPKDYPPPG